MDLLPDLWRHEYWLPPGITWRDMEQMQECPRPRDLLFTLPLALGFIVLRLVFDRVVAPPLGRYVGLRNRLRMAVAPSTKLESFYTQQNRQPSQSDIISLMAQCDKTQRQIETWFRHRRNQDRPSYTKRFCEACWRFFFYLIAFLAGLATLINKSWFWDQRECWTGYPQQDFKEQVIHHIATIFLLGFSYCSNYVRIGTLVMLLHDSSDFLLESAKMFNYGTGWRKTCDTLFVIFAAVFLVTRLVVFPSKIIHTTLVLSMEVFEPFAGYYFFNILLMVLQALHVFWAVLILRMANKFLFLGKLDKDERSDEESELEEEEDDKGEGEEKEEEGECCWERSKDALNSKLKMLSKSFVLKNLTNHRAAIVSKMRKAR
ncbi:ceramide synthase 2 isoform X2 [Salmo trutta]|uniref:Ceramide synthase 2-like n=1 Tax=Salmo trutta TaxID=8032 RepID=A0A674E291_SALTR|nr:ceramide synthase 2-like isoform X2 [Salmo trutta]